MTTNLGPVPVVATFSIVGFDPGTSELGIAVQSKFLAVGAVVPWAKAGVGAIATQSYANTGYGPDGLQMLAGGRTAEETLITLTSGDSDKALRQVGIVDAHGNASTFTGDKCMNWAGGMTGLHFAAQGNILEGPDTVAAMGRTFESSVGTLAERLLAALEAGQDAGGDRRGQQSAALLVVREKGGYAGFNDRAIDLRVDDHVSPVQELKRLYRLHQLYFSAPKESNVVEIGPALRSSMTAQLEGLQYLPQTAGHSDEAFNEALRRFIHTENFEEREQTPPLIDADVLAFLLAK